MPTWHPAFWFARYNPPTAYIWLIYKEEYDENGRCQVPWCMMGEKRYFFPPVCKKIKNFAKPIDKGRNA